jgi:hypothetical protein
MTSLVSVLDKLDLQYIGRKAGKDLSCFHHVALVCPYLDDTIAIELRPPAPLHEEQVIL